MLTDKVRNGTLSVMASDFLTLSETAAALQVSARHARRLADRGTITKVARGLIDRRSVDRYIASQRQGRTRAWAGHTAWGAIALLAGQDVDWLGVTQASRLRSTLRQLNDSSELLSRLRDRAHIHHFAGHRSALPRLRSAVATADITRLGLVDLVADEAVDGYIDISELARVVDSLGLRSGDGNVTLRVTGFDFDQVRGLVTSSNVVAALDAAGSVDPRTRGVGEHAINELLAAFRER